MRRFAYEAVRCRPEHALGELRREGATHLMRRSATHWVKRNFVYLDRLRAARFGRRKLVRFVDCEASAAAVGRRLLEAVPALGNFADITIRSLGLGAHEPLGLLLNRTCRPPKRGAATAVILFRL